MQVCTVCGSPTSGEHALTSLRGDPTHDGSWRHEVMSVCRECQDRLLAAGADGVRNLTSGKRLWLGHDTGGPAKILRHRYPDARD
jgi:hypothetical protein